MSLSTDCNLKVPGILDSLASYRRDTCRGLSASVFLENPRFLRELERRRLPRSPRNPLHELSRVPLLSHPGVGLFGCVAQGGSKKGQRWIGE